MAKRGKANNGANLGFEEKMEMLPATVSDPFVLKEVRHEI